MDNEDFIIRTIAVVVGCFVLTVGGCCVYQNKKVAESDNPIEMACALNTSEKACLLVSKQAP